MATYVTLVNLTEQGARHIAESPARYEAFKSMAEGLGVVIKSVHWTQGAYDLVLISEGTEEAMTLSTLKMAALGNVRTQTLRGFSAAEMRELVSKL